MVLLVHHLELIIQTPQLGHANPVIQIAPFAQEKKIINVLSATQAFIFLAALAVIIQFVLLLDGMQIQISINV